MNSPKPVHGKADGTVGKALEVLDSVASYERPVKFTELLENSHYPKATLYRLLQTLTNLLSNAIKFSSSGSKVWITVKKQGNEIMFMVKDQGRGIPPDKLETIFERFQQVDASDSRKKGGTGLGLAICRHIVEQHGGRIWVKSILGKGSTFFFTIPQSS